MTFIEIDRSSNELFAETNKDLIAALVSEITSAGSDDDCLDELVHDGAGALGASAANQSDDGSEDAITEAERYASEINNEGFSSQVAFILAGNGLTEGERLVREAAGLRDAPSLGC